MNPQEAHTWNAAIDAALSKYKEGKGAIKALRVKHAVTVDHIGTTTKQEVINIDD